MASLVLSFDGKLLKEFEIVKPRTSIGRRPYHDIAIDNLAVSGDHAAIVRLGNDLVLEDGGSTNGTLINGARCSDPYRTLPRDIIAGSKSAPCNALGAANPSRAVGPSPRLSRRPQGAYR